MKFNRRSITFLEVIRTQKGKQRGLTHCQGLSCLLTTQMSTFPLDQQDSCACSAALLQVLIAVGWPLKLQINDLVAAVTNSIKLSIKLIYFTNLLSYHSVDLKSSMGLTGLKSRYWQGYVLFWRLQRRAFFLGFLASGGCPHSLLMTHFSIIKATQSFSCVSGFCSIPSSIFKDPSGSTEPTQIIQDTLPSADW